MDPTTTTTMTRSICRWKLSFRDRSREEIICPFSLYSVKNLWRHRDLEHLFLEQRIKDVSAVGK